MSQSQNLGVPASKLENYQSTRGAEAYKGDYERKLHRKYSDRRERQIYRRFLAAFGPVESILDLPCGAGRLLPMLRETAGHVLEADWSSSMLALNRRDHGAMAAGYVRCSGLEVPLPDHAVDLVVSIRLSHHLSRQADRERHLRELFRVARRGVIVTWFSATSLKNLLRRARSPFNRKPAKNTLHNRHVTAVAAECHFDTLAQVPLSRVGSGHVFGLFRRRDLPGGRAEKAK